MNVRGAIGGLARVAAANVAAAGRHPVGQSTVVNLAMVGFAAIGGVIVARVLGADGRGYYAAIMAWYAIALVLSELGQSGAVTFWVAKDPRRGRNYVASARVLTFVGGASISALGVIVAPLLAHNVDSVTLAYRIAFAGCLLNTVCAAYVFALQATSIKRWNAVRLSQPVTYFLIIGAMALTGILDIVWLSVALVSSSVLQFGVAIAQCHATGLTGGRAQRSFVTPLLRYGAAYAGSSIPVTFSSQVGQIALSRTVAPAQQGEYAVALTVVGLIYPFSTAMSSVVFPRMASTQLDESGRRGVERRAIRGIVLVSAGFSVVVAVLGAPLIPLVFGADFAGSVGLVWWLIPALFLKSVSQVLSALLRGRGKPGLITYAQLGGLLVSASTILPFTEWLGIRGTALAVTAGELVVLVVLFALFVKERRRKSEATSFAAEATGTQGARDAGDAGLNSADLSGETPNARHADKPKTPLSEKLTGHRQKDGVTE